MRLEDRTLCPQCGERSDEFPLHDGSAMRIASPVQSVGPGAPGRTRTCDLEIRSRSHGVGMRGDMWFHGTAAAYESLHRDAMTRVRSTTGSTATLARVSHGAASSRDRTQSSIGAPRTALCPAP